MDRVFSFFLWPKREARGPWKQRRKKRGSITCPTDWANEANKMFIIWLCWLFRFWKGDREPEVRTATYGPGIDQSQHAKSVSHMIMPLIHWLFDFSQAIWLFRWSPVISSYSSDWLYMENAGKLNLFSNKYLPLKNNLSLYLLKLYLIKQLFYSTFWILADYNSFALRAHLLFITNRRIVVNQYLCSRFFPGVWG